MAATKKSTSKKSTAKKSTSTRSAREPSASKRSATSKSTAKKSPATKTSAAKKSTAKKSGAKKSTATKTSGAKKSTATKTPGAKKSGAKKSGATKKSTAKKSGATKASGAKKSGAKKSGAKKSGAKKSGAKRSAATGRSAAKKAAPSKKSLSKKSLARSSSAEKSGTKAPAGRDAIAVLKADHRHVEELFDKFEGLGDRARDTRESTVSQIIEELSVHAGIEETVFYPAVRERLAAGEKPMVLEALEEHHLVKLTLDELQSMSPDDERYVAKVTVLREVVEHHVEEEENELFQRVRSEFSKAELDEMGDELTAARALAPTRPHPSAPDTPPGNIVANVLVAPLDAASSLTERAADAVRDAIG